MEKLPDVVLDKIEDYVMDLLKIDHFEKFKTTLITLKRFHFLFIKGHSRWKIRYNKGTYMILRSKKNYWVNVDSENIDGIRRNHVGYGWHSFNFVELLC